MLEIHLRKHVRQFLTEGKKVVDTADTSESLSVIYCLLD